MNRKKFVVSLTFVLAIVSLIALPIGTKAKTIQEFEAEVDKYTKELEEKKKKLATNDEEIAQIKSRIIKIENQIEEAEREIETLQEEIDKSNEEIKAKSEESKKIIEYYQISNGDNVYLEYIFGATSITDMIYRISVVEQLTEYNDNLMKELERLIEENKEKQNELTEKNKELNELVSSLESERDRIANDSASIKVGMPLLEEQIKSAKSNVSYYKNLGCGATEDIQACQYRVQQRSGGSIPSTNGFYRPIEYGYITQGYGGYGGHMGVDIGSSNKTIGIYPIATGQLFFAGFDSAGALIIKIRHNYNGQYIYSTYAHMSSFSSVIAPYVNYNWGTSASISDGPMIYSDTYLGNMGSTGNSSGPHLHLEITTCDWHKGGGCTWANYQRSTVSPYNYVQLPSRWDNR